MKILAINTSSKLCSVALLEDNTILIEKHISDEKSHSQNLMPSIDSVLKEGSVSLYDIDLFACSNGPGSFTGVRIAVSTIKAFVDVTKKPAIPVSSLEGLAYNTLHSSFKEETDFICSLIDAKNGNVYAGLFQRTKDCFSAISSMDCKNIDEILVFLKENYPSHPILFVGDGTIFYKYKILENLPKSIFVMENLNCESSSSIGICAFNKYKQGIFGDSNFITPLYLRKSQAERALEGEK